MDIVGIDFESYYGADYTLSKLTTEAYVRDPRWETIMVGIKRNAEPGFWVPRDDVAYALRNQRVDQAAAYAHHAHFDGLVLNYHYGMRPKLWIDTLGMGRALYGANGRLSLEKLCERENIGSKGTEVLNAKEKRFADFTPAQLAAYGKYCVNDIEKAYLLVLKYMPQFGRGEIEIHDQVIRMFTEPEFILDDALLKKYRDWLAAEKAMLLLKAGVQQADLMSNEKFAQCLRDIGVEPPMKISPSTGKLTYAFAKTDPGIQALQEHPDEDVQILVEARLKNKTTIAEKGANRLMEMAARGAATVYLKYSGASGTHRLSGGDKFNWQSMKRGSDLRNSVQAPEGRMCAVIDSSTIEARLLDWISGQDDMVEVYRKQDNKTGPDMYCVIAGFTYEVEVIKGRSEEDNDMRQMGKKIKLGLGFGMGECQFAITVRREAKGKDGKPLILDPEFCRRVVQDVYRKRHPQVVKLWRRGEEVLQCIANGEIGVHLDYRGIVKTCKDGLIMPNGLRILYPELKFTPQMEPDPENPGAERPRKTPWGKVKGDWSFWNGKAREKIYGPKVIENIIQCLARIVVFSQCLGATKELKREGIDVKWAHSIHDEGVFLAHAFYAPYVLDVVMKWFRTPLPWCETLPLNCEGGVHRRYGLAKS
jgi:hypothetical protein